MKTKSADVVLVIEDDPPIRLLLVDTLEDEGYSVLSMADAESAWECLRHNQVDLILLDLMLPGMDGRETVRRLRADPLLSDVPVLMLTARDSVDDRVEGLAAGADDYIIKPFHPREMVARVATHLRRSERERNLNPLTHLPGSRAIERAIEVNIARRRAFAVCYADIDNFKGYNDRYGFAAGDGVIRQLADVLRDTVQDGSDPVAVVGHIGGDDFLALIEADRISEVCNAIIASFSSTLQTLYSPEDLARGYMAGHDRRGNEARIPLMSLSIAVVPVFADEPPERASVASLSQTAAEIKTFLKSKPGSGFLVDRRRTRADL